MKINYQDFIIKLGALQLSKPEEEAITKILNSCTKENISSETQWIGDTLELEKADTQCHNCLSSWRYRSKQDQNWCYTHKQYMPNCPNYRDE
jgi:Zn finger protein HypA/HybF involved in hydrogenase expression